MFVHKLTVSIPGYLDRESTDLENFEILFRSETAISPSMKEIISFLKEMRYDRNDGHLYAAALRTISFLCSPEIQTSDFLTYRNEFPHHPDFPNKTCRVSMETCHLFNVQTRTSKLEQT